MKRRKEEKKMKLKRFRRNLKAISPIISVLLMIAVAVVAALVVYAWVMGFIGFTTGKTGNAIQIQSMAVTPGGLSTLNVYVQNVGTGPVTLTAGQCLYVNGVLDTGCTVTPAGGVLAPNQTATVTSSGAAGTFTSGETVTVKVTCSTGTYSQVTQALP
jgi:flagellin-like protein